jgi:hypothetical protein
MADAADSYPMCRIPMEKGYVFDRRHLTAAIPLTRIAGRRRPPTFKERLFSDPLRGKEYPSLCNHHCTGCGYLEAFAK